MQRIASLISTTVISVMLPFLQTRRMEIHCASRRSQLLKPTGTPEADGFRAPVVGRVSPIYRDEATVLMVEARKPESLWSE